MKTISTKRFPFFIGACTLAIFLVSCSTGPDEEAVADSIQQKKTTDSTIAAEKMADKNREISLAAGIAKPNPAKANGKGEIVFQNDWEKNYDQQYTNMVIEMDKEGIYSRAEVKPSFPGGEKALARFIQDNIVYPETAIENGVEATVEVNFAVDENGKVYTPKIKNEKAGFGLDQASLDVVSKMPKWNPGQIKGKNVKSYYTLPITFMIR